MTLTFTGSTFTPPGDSQGLVGSNMLINWGDGTTEVLESSKRFPSHTYSTSGTYSIQVTGEVTNIKHYCFYGCSNLTSVSIPNSVTSIGISSFRGCSNLISADIPNSVTSLGTYCFRSCSKLIDYQLYWDNPPITWSSNLMPYNTNTYFIIPNGTTANYVAKSFPSNKLIERSA